MCRHFGTCGGCAAQHLDETTYRAWKRDAVVAALARAGVEADVLPLVDAHGAGRRRVTFHARFSAGTAEVGFMAAREHRLIPISECPVLSPALANALPAARDLAGALARKGKPLDIQITSTSNGLDVDLRGSGPLDAATTAALARLTEKHRLARLTRHGDLVLQRAPPHVTMGRTIVTLPPGSFLQATAKGEDMLSALVLAGVAKANNVLDLFCGVGPFALRIAETARVSAYDSSAPAIEGLKRAALATQKIKPIDAVTRDLFRSPLIATELKRFDAVAFDPPRQGAQAQAIELAKSAVPIVVAVSCDAGTFARDAKILIDGGYRIGAITPVDQFRYAAHVELVAKFTR